MSPIGLYIEAIRLQCYTKTQREWMGVVMCTYVCNDLYPTCSKQHCRKYALYHACSYIVGPEKATYLAPLENNFGQSTQNFYPFTLKF